MRISLTTSHDPVPVSRDQWNALAARSAAATVFQTYEWFDSWAKAFGLDHELLLLTAYDADELVGILPLIRRRGPLGLRQLEFATSLNADYQDVLVATVNRDAVTRAFCEFLQRHRAQWDMIVLRNLPVDSPTLAVMRAAFAELGMPTMERERIVCPTLAIRGREAEVQGMIDRYSVRRRVRSLEQQGPVTYRKVRGQVEIEAALPILFAQHQQRWDEAGHESQFGDPRVRDFFCRLALALDQKGWLHFSILNCGNRTVACHLGFVFGGRLYWYKPSFDPDFARFSPGLVLLRNLIADALNHGLEELDFTVGDERFKRRFTNAQRINVNLRVLHSRPMYAATLATAYARSAARIVYHGANRARQRLLSSLDLVR